jgi:hypothetical protein
MYTRRAGPRQLLNAGKGLRGQDGGLT